MKKFAFILGFLFCAYGAAYADSVGDAQFKQYVELTRNNASNPQGMTIAADYKYRMIYVTMPISINKADVTPEICRKMKREMIAGMRNEKSDCRIVRDLKISFVYTFITSDKNIFSIPVSYQDL